MAKKCNLISREDFTEWKKYVGWKILSFLFPLVGIILYFVFNTGEHKKATACLAWALVGLVLGCIIGCICGA